MTYEYKCSCGKKWEKEQKITEDAIKICPFCKEERAVRQISRSAGFVLKGSGWYRDGYT